MRVTFTRRARHDLAEIDAWIATDNPKAAARMLEWLIAAGEALSGLSLRYPEIPNRPLRKRPVGPYLIFCRVLDTVQVVRILHAARDWPSLFDEV